jgi:hypothetical protein
MGWGGHRKQKDFTRWDCLAQPLWIQEGREGGCLGFLVYLFCGQGQHTLGGILWHSPNQTMLGYTQSHGLSQAGSRGRRWGTFMTVPTGKAYLKLVSFYYILYSTFSKRGAIDVVLNIIVKLILVLCCLVRRWYFLKIKNKTCNICKCPCSSFQAFCRGSKQ